jgi:hypothetical protein
MTAVIAPQNMNGAAVVNMAVSSLELVTVGRRQYRFNLVMAAVPSGSFPVR